MTLDQIETFVTIARQGGLRAASKVLFKTQPSLSTGMKNLEDELGVTLLDRQSYRARLTPSGEALLAKAEEILNKINEFKNFAIELQTGKEPQLNLVIDYLCPMSFLLKVLHHFSKKCGQTKIEMDFEILSHSESKLLKNESNIAITPFISQHTKLDFQKICDIKIIPVVAASNLPNNKPSIKNLSALSQIIVKSSRSDSNDSFGTISESHKWIVSDQHIKRELIINGFGWGHLEASSICEELESKSLVEIRLKGISAKTVPLYIARSSEKAIGPVAADLWDFIIHEFKEKSESP